ncbi:unnamed protein product [Lactuca virosa]|uniref:Uncharacterized protein n=2 Tax=Lactuca virosa TaxID=75947 RepID=A0AAU9NLF5_9ASTR|nr:unnamed protein product [Lactuca virosa]
MNNHDKSQSSGDRDADDQQKSPEGSSSLSRGQASTDAVSGDSSTRRNGNRIGLAARLTDLFVGDGDNDDELLIQRSVQGTVMQWLHALDMQVMGACRADERLKPLLKLNVCSGVTEDRLLSHLSQHFEPSEVGLLARCLCVPLVSIRVGKIDKQGTLLIPNSRRGNLSLSLLPTSDLCISFLGDDGDVERLSTLRNISDCLSVMIEGISADSSGRSFMIRVPSGDPFYFWCSEKSRLVGYELLEKMRNLLEKKPSLADLTGISDSRLKCFVTHLRTYLVGANTQVSNNAAHVSITTPSSTTSLDQPLTLSEAVNSSQSASSKSSCGSGSGNGSVLQGSLSPRPSSFKEGPPRNLGSLKNVVKEKLRPKVEAGNGSVENSESLSANTSSCLSNQSVKDKIPEIHLFPLVSGLEAGLTENTVDTVPLSPIPSISMSMTPSLFSPYYCWCPPGPSTLQYTVAPAQMTPMSMSMSMSMADSFTLPPLSSLLAGSSSSDLLAAPKPSPLNLDEIPPFLPESTSQQFPTFTPLMTDSIVHIPVIDICSSGQAYLVSAGPGIPPLHHHLPLIQQTDSMAEKSARDTLRLLISGSSQLPSVLATVGGNQFQNGSRGLYGGATDVNHAIANSIAAMGMVSLSDRRRFIYQGDLVDLLGEDSGGGIGTRPNDDDQSSFSDSATGKTL